jgi:hypothetical protein
VPDGEKGGYRNALYGAELTDHGEALKTDRARDDDQADYDRNLLKADNDAEIAVKAQYYTSVFAVGQASIDRRRAGASAVQTAASAIATLYTGALAVSFAVGSRPLPWRGLIPVVFLGLAVVLSTAYLAYITRIPGSPGPPAAGAPRVSEALHANAFLTWVRNAGSHNRYLLNASVVALGVGLVFLPAPFITLDAANSNPDWPPTPTSVSEPALQAIVYQAQVNEIANQRSAATDVETRTGNEAWIILMAVGLILVLALPYAVDQLADSDQSDAPEEVIEALVPPVPAPVDEAG